MFRERIIVDDSLVRTPGGAELRLRLPWYRALPVSTLDALEISVDGVAVPQADIRFGVNGNVYSLEEAKDAWEDIWYVLDDATVAFPGEALAVGTEHEVEVTVTMRIPYLPVAGKALEMTERFATTMTAKELVA